MRVCLDSNCLAVLLDKAATSPMSFDGIAISEAKARLDYFIESEKPEILIPSPLYSEILMISSISQQDLDKYLRDNGSFILVNFDFRAASALCNIEKPTAGKRLNRNETMAKIKFDRQILAVAKVHGVDQIVSTDRGVHIDAGRYDIDCLCLSGLPLPPGGAQIKLELVSSLPAPEISAPPL